MTTIRTYSELIQLPTLEERYRYLSLRGVVAETTFGYERWVNQRFYRSREWRDIRYEVLRRDQGFDMGLSDFPIPVGPIIHHMNPMTVRDIREAEDTNLDPEVLITVSHRTHNAIHYGNESQLPRVFVERSPGDHILWR